MIEIINNRSINPSTSSGRTERELSAAFTAEFIEASGRTERGPQLNDNENWGKAK